MSEELPLPFWKTCSFTVSPCFAAIRLGHGPIGTHWTRCWMSSLKVWTPPVEWLDDPAPPDEQADNTAPTRPYQRRF